MKVAFVGLGVMGYPMARHLVKAGRQLAVFNGSPGKARRFADEFGVPAADTVAEVAKDADKLILCVGADHDVREVVREALPVLADRAVIVDHTTTSAKLAQEMAGLALESGRFFVDAPVSGGQAGAENGVLTAMMGGDLGAVERAIPVIRAYCRTTQRIGGSGAGQLAKMCNQICIAGVVQGLAEAIHFGQQSDLDLEAVFSAISKGAAGSWQMENRWASMSEGRYEFGFAVDLMRKDLGLVLDEARRNGSTLALTALVDQYYADVQALGGRRWDTSSLLARLKR